MVLCRARHRDKSCFNPSVGILGGQTWSRSMSSPLSSWFQSLSRDSWWSNANELHDLRTTWEVSIPQSGFLVVKLGSQRRHQEPFGRFQSLSRDSWWSNLGASAAIKSLLAGFNPSVGILGGQTRKRVFKVNVNWIVSIPQSGFLVVKLPLHYPKQRKGICFNPSVGILGGQTRETI